MKFLCLLALLLCVCFFHTSARKGDYECRYSNGNKGYIRAFFMKQNHDIATFPCNYLLANISCGGVRGTVTVLNTADKEEEFNPRITKLTVAIKYGSDASVSAETNVPNPSDKKKFFAAMKKKKDVISAFEDLWRIKYDGPKPEEESGFTASYDKKKKVMFVEFGVFRVQLHYDRKEGENNEEIRIFCPKDNFTAGTHFPNTLCGHPSDTQKDVDDILPDHEKAPDANLDGPRWVMAQLSRQNAVQERASCDITKNLLQGTCLDDVKQNVLAKCHSYYDVHSGDKKYGGCSRRLPTKDEKDMEAMNPMTLYTYCVNATCNIKQLKKPVRTWELPEDHCTFLKKVSRKCNNIQSENHMIGTIMDIGNCVGDENGKN